MEYIDELENMASALCDRPELEADDDTVATWQKLFGYSASESAKQLREHRACILPAVSTEHWQLVRAEKEAQGFDKEAYEHWCQVQSKPRMRTTPARPTRKAANYLLKMEEPLADLDTVKMAAGRTISTMTEIPGADDQGNPTKFCVVDRSAKASIEGQHRRLACY